MCVSRHMPYPARLPLHHSLLPLSSLYLALRPSISSLSRTFFSSHRASLAHWSLIVSAVPWNAKVLRNWLLCGSISQYFLSCFQHKQTRVTLFSQYEIRWCCYKKVWEIRKRLRLWASDCTFYFLHLVTNFYLNRQNIISQISENEKGWG